MEALRTPTLAAGAQAFADRPAGADADLLRRRCTPEEVPFASTVELAEAPGVLPQGRALEALDVAAGIRDDGFNVFVTGPAGTGKRALLDERLRALAAARPTPPDMVHLHNFADPRRPHAIAVPAGTAENLDRDLRQFVEDARRRLTETFESDSYRARHRALHEEADRRRGEILKALQERANAAGVAIQITPTGAMTAPLADGRPLTPDEIAAMPEEAHERYASAVHDLEAPVDDVFAAMHDIDRELRERHKKLEREVAVHAIGWLVDDLRRTWAHVDRVVAWLEELREDVIAHLDLFRGAGSEGESPTPPELPLPNLPQLAGAAFTARYLVNVLVARKAESGAPVITASDPSFADLFGRVEYETAFGSAVTDHRHLRAGLLHRANGGFLVLDAIPLLTTPFVWPRLKEVLRSGKLSIENVAVQYMLFPGVTLDPEPADIDVTVVLIGSLHLHMLLMEADEDMGRLFKIRADVDDELPRDEAGIRAYAAVLARVAREHELLPLDRGAIAAVVEHGSRLAGHRDRLSTRVRDLRDVATEAGHIAAAEDAESIGAAHVAAALASRRRRSDRVEERIRRSTLEGTIDIAVEGGVIGQVNGLAVASLGDHAFGHPVRITATVLPGDGEVVDIDREARLSGPIHSKGVMILAGYLAGRYSADRPLTLRANIVFEQSYGPIEGDSASLAELLTLLSALARVPVDQAVAVTGSVDQHGAVQAVGGINEKIEGFFDLCAAHGLTGRQGVLVPASNLAHLMLDARVADAVREGAFHVWPVTTVDEALDLMTGRETADAVRDRLEALREAARAARRGR